MPFRVGVSGAWKNAPREWVGVGGVWKATRRMWIGVGGVWKQFYAALSVSVDAYFETFPPPGSASVTTLTVSPTITGGSGSYTYSWSYVSGDSFTINSPTSSSTSFTTTMGAGSFKSGTYRCTVTDTTYGVSASSDFGVSLTRNDF